MMFDLILQHKVAGAVAGGSTAAATATYPSVN